MPVLALHVAQGPLLGRRHPKRVQPGERDSERSEAARCWNGLFGGTKSIVDAPSGRGRSATAQPLRSRRGGDSSAVRKGCRLRSMSIAGRGSPETTHRSNFIGETLHLQTGPNSIFKMRVTDAFSPRIGANSSTGSLRLCRPSTGRCCRSVQTRGVAWPPDFGDVRRKHKQDGGCLRRKPKDSERLRDAVALLRHRLLSRGGNAHPPSQHQPPPGPQLQSRALQIFTFTFVTMNPSQILYSAADIKGPGQISCKCLINAGLAL